jgi:hypothetical protein
MKPYLGCIVIQLHPVKHETDNNLMIKTINHETTLLFADDLPKEYLHAFNLVVRK